MSRHVQKSALILVPVIFLALSLSGCDLLSGLINGGGNGGDPIEIPDSVAADPSYASLETDFLTAINDERTSHTVATFAARDANLDALARRYAKAGAVDTIPANLKSRVATAIGTCSEASFFIGGATTTTNYVSTLMAAWLAGPGGSDTMNDDIFTKIGIGIVVGTNAALPPGDTWHSVVILLAKP
jgi:hypothetical protein